MSDALDMLKAGRARIANPADWGKGPRPYGRSAATCCAVEAIEDARPWDGKDMNYLDERKRAFRALSYAAGLDDGEAITVWNDLPERTHAEVIAAYNLAIATLGLGSRHSGGQSMGEAT